MFKYLVALALLQGCAATQQEQIEAALALPKEHFRNTAVVQDTELDTRATITTINGFTPARKDLANLLGVGLDDNFLRAFIDKKTGKTVFQVYQVTYYSGRWRFYTTVNFQTPTGPQEKLVIPISRNVLGCRGGCDYVEHVAFEVEEDLLRSIAKIYAPGQRFAWKFRFNAKSGDQLDEGMLIAEVAGFMDRVDEYKASVVRPKKLP